MKKYLSVLLAVAMLFSVMIPIIAFADTRTVRDSVSLLQEGDFDFSYNEEINAQFSENSSPSATSAGITIKTALNNVSSMISNLSQYRLKGDEMHLIYTSVINDNPNLFYVSSTLSYSYSKSTGYVSSITPLYVMSSSEIASAKRIFDNGVAEGVSRVTDDMNEAQKVLVLHDYLCEIARYPKLSVHPDNEIYHSAYGVFYDGDTVCAGYALAFSYILKQVGIESCYVISSGMQHAWNAVKVDGSWYYVDLTYDDVGYYGDYNTLGAIQHRCFLKSKEMLSSEYCFLHFDYQQPSEVNCVDTKYDDYFWNDVDTTVEVVNGDYYYMKPNYTTRFATFVKRDAAGNESVACEDEFKFTYMTLTSQLSDENNVAHSVTFYEPLIRLKYCDDRFYLSAYNGLYSITPDKRSYEIYRYLPLSSANLILGMTLVDGDISTQLKTTTGEYTKHNRIDYFNSYFTAGGGYNNYADKDNNGYINAIDYLLIKNN